MQLFVRGNLWNHKYVGNSAEILTPCLLKLCTVQVISFGAKCQKQRKASPVWNWVIPGYPGWHCRPHILESKLQWDEQASLGYPIRNIRSGDVKALACALPVATCAPLHLHLHGCSLFQVTPTPVLNVRSGDVKALACLRLASCDLRPTKSSLAVSSCWLCPAFPST